MKAIHFSKLNDDALKTFKILPPKEMSGNSAIAYGSIRDPADFTQLIVTGPRLPVRFAGLYNKITFSVRGPGTDDPSHEWENFLGRVLAYLEDEVRKSPEKFRPGLKNLALLQFDNQFYHPSNYSTELSEDYRIKLSIKKGEIDENGESVDMIDTIFLNEEGNKLSIDDIYQGSEIIPMVRIGYYRNGNKFGLSTTLVKGLVFPAPKRARIEYEDIDFDL